MKKYRFLKDFLLHKKSDIVVFDESRLSPGDIAWGLEQGIFEELQSQPKNRFLLKADDMEVAKRYWSINSGILVYDFEWSGIEYELRMLENNNVFTTQEEAENQVKRNEAVNKYLKCVAEHNEARGFKAEFNGIQSNCLFIFNCEINDINLFVLDYYTQFYPLRYYFHKDDVESIRKELGDECLKLVFGGE